MINFAATGLTRLRSGDARVITFASAKGGTGKTILAASTAMTLLRSGQRVLCIDGDFSTRGLSLFILGNILYTSELTVRPEQCLADFVLAEYPNWKPTPRRIEQYGVQFHIILSNTDLWRSGVPDKDILDGKLDPARYVAKMEELLRAFSSEYDYIIVDTRGGYDFTSAVPTLLSSGYVIVLEPDKISLDQIAGFNKLLTDFAEARRLEIPAGGFIINKASFDPNRTEFPEDLAKRYSVRTYGIIPADVSCIRAYEVKDNPVFRFPDSDFAYWFMRAFRNLINPRNNWEDGEKILQYEQFEKSIRTGWASRKTVDVLLSWVPFLQLVPIVLAAFLYFLFRLWPSDGKLYAAYAALVLFLVWSMVGSLLAGIQWLRWREVSKVASSVVTTCAIGGILFSLYFMIVDVPPNILMLKLQPQALRVNQNAIAGIKDLQTTGLTVADAWKDLASSAVASAEDRVYSWADEFQRAQLGIHKGDPLPDAASRTVASLSRQIIDRSIQKVNDEANFVKTLINARAGVTVGASESVEKILEHPRSKIDYREQVVGGVPDLKFPSVDEILDAARRSVLVPQANQR